jgi:hypothetical protein
VLRDTGDNGTAGTSYFSTKVQCSICDEEALIVFDPPLCQHHWEVALLIEGARGAGLEVTAENLVDLKRSSAHLVDWKVADGDVPALLATYQAVCQ